MRAWLRATSPAEPGDLLSASWPCPLRVCCSADAATSEGLHVIAMFDSGSVTLHPGAFTDTRVSPRLRGPS